MIFPDWVVIWFAVAGGCVFILGAYRAGILLAMPAFVRFILWPNIASLLGQFHVAVLLLLVPVILVLGGILLLQAIVRLCYGEAAGGYVAGNYLMRVFDSIGRASLLLISAPFRLLRRRNRR